MHPVQRFCFTSGHHYLPLFGFTRKGNRVMKKQGIFRQILFPILLILIVMVFSSHLYDYSRTIKNPFWYTLVVHTSATLMFLTTWMGLFLRRVKNTI